MNEAPYRIVVEFSECRGHRERSSLTEREDNANAHYFAYNIGNYFIVGDGVLYEQLGSHFDHDDRRYACLKNVLTGEILDMDREHFDTMMYHSDYAWRPLTDMEVIAWAAK